VGETCTTELPFAEAAWRLTPDRIPICSPVCCHEAGAWEALLATDLRCPVTLKTSTTPLALGPVQRSEDQNDDAVIKAMRNRLVGNLVGPSGVQEAYQHQGPPLVGFGRAA